VPLSGQIKYVSELKLHTARTILRLLTTLRRASERALDYVIAWRYFRALRLPCFERKAFHLRNKQVLRNRLRLCARLRYLERGMPAFRRLRVLWRCWHKLLRHAELRRRSRTPALRDHLVTLARRAAKLSDLLRARGVTGDAPLPCRDLHPKTTDLHACLLRWAAFAADACHARAAARLVAWRAHLATQRRALRGLMLVGLGDGQGELTLARAARRARDAAADALDAATKAAAESLDRGESYKDLATNPSFSGLPTAAAGSTSTSPASSPRGPAQDGPRERAAKRRHRALVGRHASRVQTAGPTAHHRTAAAARRLGEAGGPGEPGRPSGDGGATGATVGFRDDLELVAGSAYGPGGAGGPPTVEPTEPAADGPNAQYSEAALELDGISHDDNPIGNATFAEANHTPSFTLRQGHFMTRAENTSPLVFKSFLSPFLSFDCFSECAFFIAHFLAHIVSLACAG
jgi:hypothetical protein